MGFVARSDFSAVPGSRARKGNVLSDETDLLEIISLGGGGRKDTDISVGNIDLLEISSFGNELNFLPHPLLKGT